ncbi:MAG TPA: glycosyltransferase [Candidatus Acidoferrum sp.]|nr:glycosyltransferase [Candidatus Acidoferrum sp.]
MQKLSCLKAEECGTTGAAVPHEKSMTFSIIIPALNEEHVIGQCLNSIARLEFPRQKFEIIVVDNGSSDRTREIAESYHEAVNITVLLHPKINISSLRNAGAAASNGEYLIFLDADMVVHEHWLQRAAKLFVSSKAEIIGGFYEVPENSSWVARVWFTRKMKEVNLSPSYAASGNLMIRRSQFDAIGGFDESLATSEDCDFCCRARALGLSIAQYRTIAVVHLGSPQTLQTFFRREIWHGSSVFRVFLLNFSSFQNGKPVFFAIYTLLCLLMIIITGIISAYRGNISLASLFVGMLLLPPSVLALGDVRRTRWQDFPALFVLYLVYGIARAISLLGFRQKRIGRQDHGEMQTTSP